MKKYNGWNDNKSNISGVGGKEPELTKEKIMDQADEQIPPPVAPHSSTVGNSDRLEWKYIKTLIPVAKKEIDKIHTITGHYPPVLMRLVSKLESLLTSQSK